MVSYHQIFSSRIPAPPLNTVLYCHRFSIYSLLLFSLVITCNLLINHLFLPIIHFYFLIYCIGFLAKLIFQLIRWKRELYSWNFSLYSWKLELVSENFSQHSSQLELYRENFSLISSHLDLVSENFSRYCSLLELYRTNIQFTIINSLFHCNYGERLNMPAKKCLLNIKGSK